MEQIKHNHSGRANFEARTVKGITESAESIFNKASVKAALDEMQARAMDSSPVIDQRGELLGTVSKNKMNREVVVSDTIPRQNRSKHTSTETTPIASKTRRLRQRRK